MIYSKVKCYHVKSGEFVGYLGSTNNSYVALVGEADAVRVSWVYDAGPLVDTPEKIDVYLDRDGSPDRYLGWAEDNYAGWGLKGGGYRHPVLRNVHNNTIALKSAPASMVYGPFSQNGTKYVRWTDGTPNDDVLQCVLEDDAGLTVPLDRWMHEKWDLIRATPLWQIAMPGGHDSGTYGETFFQNLSSAQGLPIVRQLQLGIRYLDLRFNAAADPAASTVRHGLSNFNVRLSDVMNDIGTFLMTPGTEREVLILLFSFEALDDAAEARHCEYVKKQIGARRILTRSAVAELGRAFPAACTPEQLVTAERRVIVMWNGPNRAALEKRGELNDFLWWTDDSAHEHFLTTQDGNEGAPLSNEALLDGRRRDLHWWADNYRGKQTESGSKYWWRLGVHWSSLPGWHNNLKSGTAQSLPHVLAALKGELRQRPWNLVCADLFLECQYWDFAQAVIAMNGHCTYSPLAAPPPA